MDNLAALTLEQLRELKSSVIREIDGREQAERITQQIKSLSMQLLDSTGRANGADWTQPVGAHDAYPVGWIVRHDDAQWRSLIEGNMWPPQDGLAWERLPLTSEEDEAPTPTDHAPPE